MPAAFQNAAVSLLGRTLDARFRLVNRSADAWRAADGWGAGYHLFDDPTGTLVVDGDRTPLNLAAGASSDLQLQIETPAEPGDYSIFVSPMREHVAWFYGEGWPFLLIEVSVDDSGVATLKRWRIADRATVRVRRFLRGLQRAFTLPFISIWRNRNLIRTLVRRDVMGRYTGSFGGAFWTILNPLLLMLTYFFVFGVVMRTRFGNDTSKTAFALYFLAGMLPWIAFSEAIGRSPSVMLEHRNFIKKLVFPVETLPVNIVASGLVTEFFGLLMYAAALLVIRGQLSLSLIFLPAVLIPQILFTVGLAWFLSALGAFVKDLGQIIGYLLTILMFLTPIFYPETALPPFAADVIRANPIYVLVRAYRAILLESRAPDWAALAWFTLLALAVFIAGHAWFYKLRKSFADLI